MSQTAERPVLSLEEKRRLLAQKLQSAGRGNTFPLSFAQQRLWVVHQMDPASAAYNMSYALHLRGGLDVDVLSRALTELVRRHEVLRTVFPTVGGAPVQLVRAPSRVTPRELDLRGLDPAAREAEAARLSRDEAARPFDLAEGPLLRTAVVQLDDADHLVLFTLHHVVSDGWSQGVMARELSELYSAFVEGREPVLPALSVQYADFAAWQRGWLSGDVLAGHVGYWRERLAGAPPLLELRTDRPRTSAPGAAADSRSFVLSAATADRLRAVSRGEGATLFMTLLAAFQLLLSRYAGQDDVVVGTPVAGRSRLEVENLIGFFVNMLPLRLDLSGDPSFRALVGRARESVLQALEHEDVPFEKLVDELQPGRSLTHSPFFQATFALQPVRHEVLRLGGLETLPAAEGREQARFDLGLTMSDHGDWIAGSLNYRTDLFGGETIARMVGHLERVLEQVAEDADAPLSRLDLAGPAERARVVEEWNRTDRPFPRGVTIHERFQAQVAERPDAAALVWDALQLTYSELDARANRLAHHLVRQGVGPDARVGVLLERSAELIVSILAVLKAGGCYVPLDPAYPPERLRMMLADSGSRVLVTRTEHAGSLSEGDLRIVCLDGDADAIAAEPADAPDSGATAENLAYVVYTSGSTGRPKGVMVTHGNVVQLVVETDYVDLRPGDRIAQASNASFDALAFETWGAFLNGATLIGIPRDVLLSPPALRDLLREQAITTLYQTTALLNQLSREQPDIFAPLRDVLFGGQASDADRVRALLRTGKPQRLLHMYGPTETTAWCSWENVEDVDDDALTVSVGRPTGNQRIYILDAALRPAPLGIPGEAYVGGAGVVRGYLDRPGLTAQRFLPDPFATEPGARMYRTGDRLRWKADGTLEFVGRLDAQVKIRGFRIEPGEIESVLSAHAEVSEARVVVREDAPGEHRLVAYVVGAAEPEALRTHLRQVLPEYMVPSAIVAMDRLPVTPNGKLDERALPAPELSSAAEFTAPRSPAEEVLAGIWAEVLHRDRISIDDDFFRLGGHSLLAVRMVSRIRQLFGVELPLRTLFEGPTVAALAEAVEALRRAGLPQLPPVVPVERTRPLPLSFAQERLWFLDRMQPGSTTYNMFWPLRLSGALDAAALERAVVETVRRHESLRTTFREVDGDPVQVIAPFAGFVLEMDDLSALDGDAREAAVRQRVAREEARPYDLAAGPLFRPALLRLADDEHVLLLGMHHVISDGWSMRVLFGELAALYAAFARGGDADLPALEVQYADYAVWQREQLGGQALDRHLAYWTERLAGAPAVLQLPTDRPRTAVQRFRGARHPFELPPALAERLAALGQREGATLFMVLLSAFQVLLSRYGAGDDVVVGTPVAGRTRGETEGLIGFFVNTLALRTDLRGDPGFREVLRRVREVTLGAYEHHAMPFEKLVAALQPERSLGHAPLVQAMFTLHTAEQGPAALPGLTVAGVDAPSTSTRYDLTLDLSAHGRGISGALEYSTDLFDAETIGRMAGHLERVLEQVSDDADVRASRLELAGSDERSRVVVEWNRTNRPFPRGVTIHERFAAQAAERPDAAALVWDGIQLTYAGLDARANRLARHLRGLGVGPDVRVGVLVERGVELIVSVLAVLKAGGCYVPLDPGYPPERLRMMMTDSGAGVLVTLARFAEGAGEAADGLRIVRLDGDADAIAREASDAPESGATPANLAYVVYTSGSTGRPKGVMVTHRNVIQLVVETDYVELRPGDRVAQASNASFDALAFETWGAFLNGATLVGIPRDVLLSTPALHALLREQEITTLYQTTALLNQLSREQPDIFCTLRDVLFGGQAVDADSVRRVLKAGGPRRLLHMYGPTETTAWCSWENVKQVDDGALTVSVGRPTGNQRIYLLDSALQPAPLGVPGEAYVGGAGVVRGYLDRPGLTAQRFVPDPFATEPGARMYRTGDRLRWKADGALEFMGRLDAQVKIRGFRIEPGEIESVLCAHAEVAEARVVVREDEPGEKRLVAYVVGGAEPEALRSHLRQVLPDYMVPAAIVAMDRLPVTPNGKLDERALPAPELASAAEYVAPRTEVEATVAALWAEVLEVERVGVRDGFFERGGHSLLIMRLIARVRADFGVELSIRSLFAAPTVEGMAAEIERLIYEEILAMPEPGDADPSDDPHAADNADDAVMAATPAPGAADPTRFS